MIIIFFEGILNLFDFMIIFFNVIVMKNIVRKFLIIILFESFNIEKSIINVYCFKVVSVSSMLMKNVKL